MKTEPVKYWTPSGFTSGAEPPAYTAVTSGDETDWAKSLTENGYEKWEEIGEEFDLVQVEIWRHKEDGHLLVEQYVSYCGTYEMFLVASEHVTEFFFIEIPRLMNSWAQAKIARQQQKIAKTLIAFVRHGHGQETIDEYGEQSLDDYEAWKKHQRLERLKRQQSKEEKA